MNRLYALALLAVVLMSMVAVFAAPPDEDAPVAAATASEAVSESASDYGESQALLIKRDSSGQFHLSATLNGSSERFLVDTGADMVALTEDAAADLGLVVGEMQPVIQTASGVGYGAPVTIEEMIVAGVELRNVDAMVVQGLSTNLLGQSVLKKLGGVSLRGDRMVIHPR